MTLEKLLQIYQVDDIPMDAALESDSGWECGPTNMDGVYYNPDESRVIFTQGIGSEYDYCEPEWKILFKIPSEFYKNINSILYVDDDIMLSPMSNNNYIETQFKYELKKNNEFELYYGVKESEERYKEISLNRPLFWGVFANKEEERYYKERIGYIGLNYDDNDFDIEIYIFKEFRRKGYAKKVLKKVIEYLKAGQIKIYDDEQQLVKALTPSKIQAIVREENIASRKLLESCGFKTAEGFVISMMMFNDEISNEDEAIYCIEYVYD